MKTSPEDQAKMLKAMLVAEQWIGAIVQHATNPRGQTESWPELSTGQQLAQARAKLLDTVEELGDD